MNHSAKDVLDTRERREFLRCLPGLGAAMLAAQWLPAGATEAPASTGQPRSSPEIPASWKGSEQIAMLIYPEFTALDLVGPQYLLAGLMGAKVHIVAATMEPVRTDTGLIMSPTMTLAECPKDLDILFVPGGAKGTVAAMRDRALVEWVADHGRRAKLISSVCTGSMILAQAGLLRGVRATSHWVTRDLLSHFGAIPVDERVVWDGKVVTGAGVSAGLDLGLVIAGRLRDSTYAQALQLLAEYAPQPPFNAGTPKTAPAEVRALIGGRFQNLRSQMIESARDALPGSQQ